MSTHFPLLPDSYYLAAFLSHISTGAGADGGPWELVSVSVNSHGAAADEDIRHSSYSHFAFSLLCLFVLFCSSPLFIRSIYAERRALLIPL